SHLDTVLHMLWERNMPGEFFVHPSNVGRAGYLSWNELRGMASAGMSIQSHGYTRRYLTDLDDTSVANELLRSRKVIEDRIGEPVSVFAAQGGRINHFIAALARRVGYKAVCGSRPGQWHRHSRKIVIPRIAVRVSTSGDEISGWLSDRPLALTALAGRYRVLQVARWALGNETYDHLRQRYLEGH
ncbi:MAG: polysaccharide deacetylase family protein, partial [Proteobacteria bacterium]|nr:polysaccharide deacetylase family protein [Pseudomonadota bacterium]